MAPEPRRKDERGHREIPEGQKPAEEGDQQAVEEYTDYQETGPAAPGEAPEREAGLQPGGDAGEDTTRKKPV